MRNNRIIGVAVLTAILLLISFIGYQNMNITSYRLTPTPPQDLPSKELFPAYVPSYGLTIGNFTLSSFGHTATYSYIVLPLGGQEIVNLSNDTYITHSFLNLFSIVEVNNNNNAMSTLTNLSLCISNLTLVSPQGITGGIKFSIFKQLNVIDIDAIPQNDMYSALSSYPGFHTFYLNFTATEYLDIGPFEISGQSITISLSWNSTILD